MLKLGTRRILDRSKRVRHMLNMGSHSIGQNQSRRNSYARNIRSILKSQGR
jgi:hypothetical protein